MELVIDFEETKWRAPEPTARVRVPLHRLWTVTPPKHSVQCTLSAF
jgi:hypothetical protein